ncbi:hypothetical protein [Actinoplanes siamensis]|uniref:Uncharacterized protein n=1 Tax=Actinoplanes siamensis TaxID=1223317 RepID=A0A919NCM3_9ACTN|nr:hypothetical protein [Actinoplanes siamensis]GIF08698.1 hypothetical protein Asi03nite_62360 [Actinoplanes siamensis]
MTGPEHYLEAESLLEMADDLPASKSVDRDYFAAAAQTHATLALAAATALQVPGGEDAGMRLADAEAWEAACAETDGASRPVDPSNVPVTKW